MVGICHAQNGATEYVRSVEKVVASYPTESCEEKEEAYRHLGDLMKRKSEFAIRELHEKSLLFGA